MAKEQRKMHEDPAAEAKHVDDHVAALADADRRVLEAEKADRATGKLQKPHRPKG